jgi:hypothetical protein
MRNSGWFNLLFTMN